MCILLCLIIFGPCVRGAKVGNTWKNKLSNIILWVVRHPSPIVWLIVESNNFFSFQTGIFHNQCTIQTTYIITEWEFFHFQYYQLSFHHPVFSRTCPFLSILSSSYFIQPIHHTFGMNGSCTFYQIYPQSCDWDTNTNLVHIW